MGRGGAGFIVQDGGKGLEAAAYMGEGLAVVGKRARFLPCVQYVVVALLEACQTLLGIAGRRLLCRRAADESRQLAPVSQIYSASGETSLTNSMASVKSPFS